MFDWCRLANDSTKLAVTFWTGMTLFPHSKAISLFCSEFQSLRNYTQQLFQAIKSQMPRRESARRKHALAHEYDIMETLNMRLTLLQMTFHKHIKQSHCCFFAGEVLDEVHRILIYLRTTPILERAHKVTDELFDLSTMAMEYFKEFIEPYLPDINYIGDYHFYDPYSSSSSSTSVAVNNSINSIDSIKDFGSYSTSEVGVVICLHKSNC